MEITENFLTDLKTSIIITEQKNEHKPSTYYKPSSLKCIRNMYFQKMGYEPLSSKDPCLVNICNSGSDIHIRVQQQVKDMIANGFDCEYLDVEEYIKEKHIPDIEVKGKSGMETKLLNTQLNMMFMCDGLIKYKDNYYILEIKTESSRKWLNREDVDPDHKNQAISYSYSLGLPDVLFIYINRDFLDMKSYLYTPTEEEKFKVLGIIKDCDLYVMEGKIPPKPEISGRICQYCEYKEYCKKDIDS